MKLLEISILAGGAAVALFAGTAAARFGLEPLTAAYSRLDAQPEMITLAPPAAVSQGTFQTSVYQTDAPGSWFYSKPDRLEGSNLTDREARTAIDPAEYSAEEDAIDRPLQEADEPISGEKFRYAEDRPQTIPVHDDEDGGAESQAGQTTEGLPLPQAAPFAIGPAPQEPR